MRRQMVTTMYNKYNYPTLPSPSLSSMVTTISSSAKTKCTENVSFYNEADKSSLLVFTVVYSFRNDNTMQSFGVRKVRKKEKQ